MRRQQATCQPCERAATGVEALVDHLRPCQASIACSERARAGFEPWWKATGRDRNFGAKERQRSAADYTMRAPVDTNTLPPDLAARFAALRAPATSSSAAVPSPKGRSPTSVDAGDDSERCVRSQQHTSLQTS